MIVKIIITIKNIVNFKSIFFINFRLCWYDGNNIDEELIINDLLSNEVWDAKISNRAIKKVSIFTFLNLIISK